ncbi:MAG: RNA polymerase sporulation sigma factor SigK [Oscillospiraceae bacterium]|nr:RNA polymerase sporulation sigma factor SigK [Oscillospiraceae bacterium]
MYSSLVLFALGNLVFLVLHLSGTGSFPKPLSAAEERECLLAVRRGDAAARNRLIEHNLRLVAHIIKKYYAASRDQDDLSSIGTIWMIKAVSTFDCEKGTRFATYASRCVENEILMFFRSKRKSAGDVFISDPIDTDKAGNALTLLDVMSQEDDMLDRVDLQLRSEELHRCINSALDSRERQIINLRYGLRGQLPLTQREVAKLLHISRSYVSRLEKKALEKLKGSLSFDSY